jgi:hypothetical protein
MIVHPLRASQFLYGAESACSYTHLCICHYFLHSPSRVGTSESLAWWIRIACFMHLHEKPAVLLNRQPDAYVTPREAHNLSWLVGPGLVYVEELVGTMHTAVSPCPKAGSVDELQSKMRKVEARDSPSPDGSLAAFVDEGAINPLWKCLRRMFFQALRKPIAATFTTADDKIAAISMRWNETLSQVTQKKLIEELYCMTDESCVGADTPDELDFSLKPSLADLDRHIAVQTAFYIDFVDTHGNNNRTGLPNEAPGGTSVWVQFNSLVALEEYLRKRYPHHPKSNLTARQVGSFDLALWEAPKPEQFQEASNELSLYIAQPAFLEFVNRCESLTS